MTVVRGMECRERGGRWLKHCQELLGLLETDRCNGWKNTKCLTISKNGQPKHPSKTVMDCTSKMACLYVATVHKCYHDVLTYFTH